MQGSQTHSFEGRLRYRLYNVTLPARWLTTVALHSLSVCTWPPALRLELKSMIDDCACSSIAKGQRHEFCPSGMNSVPMLSLMTHKHSLNITMGYLFRRNSRWIYGRLNRWKIHVCVVTLKRAWPWRKDKSDGPVDRCRCLDFYTLLGEDFRSSCHVLQNRISKMCIFMVHLCWETI